jgi:hypothetical protein
VSLTSRSVATAADFNALLASALSLYSVGSGDRGFGQTALALDPIKTGQKITAAQWGVLRSMLSVCASHVGLDPTLLPGTPKTGMVAPSAQAISDLIGRIDTARFNQEGDALATTPNVVTGRVDTVWNGVLQLTVDVDFLTEDEARYFFNSGGQITLTPSHTATASLYDENFSAFLARQVGTVTIGAHQTTWVAASDSGTTLGGYYGFEPNDALVMEEDSTTSTSVGFPDSVKVRIRRTNFSGENGGNGRSFQIAVQVQYLGNVSGSILSSGTSISVGMIYASKYLKVSCPNITITGFTLLSNGNAASSETSDGGILSQVPQADDPAVFSPEVGTGRYIVPEYATLTVELLGAGGSEGASTGPYPRRDGSQILLVNGNPGGDATIASLGLTATGGGGGGCYDIKTAKTGPVGPAGVGEGGDVDTTGGGASGGSGAYAGQSGYFNGAAGGAGGYTRKIYVRGAVGAPLPGSLLVAVVPEGGSLRDTEIPTDPKTVFYPGADGANGSVRITPADANSGSISFSIPGDYQFKVPTYASLTISVKGAGGGAAQNLSPTLSDEDPAQLLRNGQDGGDAAVAILNLIGAGGQGGQNVPAQDGSGMPTGAAGAAGTGSGGDVNTSGAGAIGGGVVEALPNAGGNGGYAQKTFAAGDPAGPVPGQVLLISVPAGGSGAAPSPLSKILGLSNPAGQDGNVTISWTVNELVPVAGSVRLTS